MKSKNLIERQSEFLKNIDLLNQHERLAERVTPYWQLSYEEELKIKQDKCKDSVKRILQTISRQKEVDDNAINVQQIIPSPRREEYRNKDELSIYSGADDSPKTVGILFGNPGVGRSLSVPVTQLRSMKSSHKEIGQMFQDLIRSSALPASHQLFDGGFWRGVTIGSNEAGDHWALIVTNPRGMTEAELRDQEETMRRHFAQCAPLLALHHQSCPHMRCTRGQAAIHHLSGNKHVTQRVCGKPIRVSVDTYFPLNTPAAELSFQEVLRLAGLKHTTTLLDLYCGAGPLSVLAHERARGYIGIDSLAQAVEDARHNAETDGAHNCRFEAGPVERLLPSVLSKLDKSSNIAVVISPGLAGANESVISALRRNSLVRRLVYVARSDPDGNNRLVLKNFVQLCERVAPLSRPFRLTAASPVDLCPLTDRCDIILRFDKME